MCKYAALLCLYICFVLYFNLFYIFNIQIAGLTHLIWLSHVSAKFQYFSRLLWLCGLVCLFCFCISLSSKKKTKKKKQKKNYGEKELKQFTIRSIFSHMCFLLYHLCHHFNKLFINKNLFAFSICLVSVYH